MAQKETSPELSSLAAEYLNIRPEQIKNMGPAELELFAGIVRRLAGSCLSQDETRGQHGKET